MTETPHPGYVITNALQYLDDEGMDIPVDLRLKALQYAGKAASDLAQINSVYHDIVTEALTTYFEGGIVTGPRNRFRVGTTEAFYDAFYLGYADGGGEPDADARSWLEARVNQEYGYIDMLFQQVKELRKEEDFDFFSFVTARADGYTRTLKEIYNSGYARSSKDIMVLFTGDDGAESCTDCQKYKGQRHRLSWFIRRNAIPPFGVGLECHPGGRCQHYLQNDKGERVTG